MNRFNTTRWSLILDACAEAQPPSLETKTRGRPALDTLCRQYFPPVLAYIRRHGYAAHDAEDLAQSFFLRFIERRWYANATPQRGRFRALMLTALQRFLLDAQASRRATKRGGASMQVEFSDDAGCADSETPEQVFTRAWVAVLIERAKNRLRDEFANAGKASHFDRMWTCIDGPAENADISALAAEIGARRNTVAAQLYRMKSRFRHAIRQELQETVGSEEDLDLELQELRVALEAGT